MLEPESDGMIADAVRIPIELKGSRVDQLAAQYYPQFSRAKLQAWIRSGDLTLNDQTVKPNLRVKGEETLRLVVPDELPVLSVATPEEIPLDIVFEDDAFMVINKPAGLVVHPAPGHATGTLVNALLHHAPILESLPRAGIVHRIDKDTTGLLLVAKTLASHTALVRQLEKRAIHREYRALVVGEVISGGTVEARMGRHPQHRIKMAVLEHGRSAVTHYRVEKRFPQFTQLSVRLETGRTHQIRVHMMHQGFPLVGDPLYGRAGWQPKGAPDQVREQLALFNRQALHAARLGVTHPTTDEWLEFSVPLPEDYQQLLAALSQWRV